MKLLKRAYSPENLGTLKTRNPTAQKGPKGGAQKLSAGKGEGSRD